MNGMKRLSILFCILVLGTTMLFGQQAGPKFTYTKPTIDLGTLYVDELESELKVKIEFSNTGNQPLIVSQVRGCCGTRITSWTKEPIEPQAKGTIGIEFRLNPTPQNISRTITATSNDPEQPASVIRVIGKVVEGKSPEQS
jgi:hypothetical protein